jgi:hypothetical protein
MKKTTTNRLVLAAAISAVLATLPGQAANTFYAPGDLILFFQKEGGTDTIYANLGVASGFRGNASGNQDAGTALNILDLNSTLEAAFGLTWKDDPTIYAGLAAVQNTSSISNAVAAGDPARTIYISQSRGTVGDVSLQGSTGYTIGGSTGMSGASNAISNMNSVFENQYEGTVALSPIGVSGIDNNNPFLAPGIQGTAFGTFAGGVQQVGTAGTRGNVDGLGDIEFALDLHRILAKTGLNGQVSGPQYSSTYEGSILIGSNGSVSFIPEPSSVTLLGAAAGALLLRRRRNE